jgi:Fic family protein
VGGERVKAFLPAPLPPAPALLLDGQIQALLEAAILAVGRLDGASALVPDRPLFLYMYVRKEAVLSSQIEGTQSSLSDLLLHELHEAPGVPVEDVVEVSNYVAALNHGIARLAEGFPLSNRLLREIHAILLSKGRGAGKDPGAFRLAQNWIGGARPGTATYVPPPPTAVEDCMAELEKFLHADDDLPTLLRAGLAHVQFETIHPFLDGNGRVGRLLITLLLHEASVLRDPLLYLSLYFKENRPQYYELLDRVRRDGDWETWLEFFLKGVALTADGAVTTIRRIDDLFRADRSRIETKGRPALTAMRVHGALMERPVANLAWIAKRTGLAFRTVATAMDLLVELGVARELTGGRRNRIFRYEAYVAILSEGTAPL